MAHHGNSFEREFKDVLAAQWQEAMMQNQKRAESLGLGPTGNFPEGHLNDNDAGEIKIAIGIESGKVVINFGASLSWIGFTPEQADQIAYSLIEKSSKIRGRG